MRKNRIYFAVILLAALNPVNAEVVKSPDGRMEVNVYAENGRAYYSVTYDGLQMVCPSQLGLTLDFGDLTSGLKQTAVRTSEVDERYRLTRTKTAEARYHAGLMEVDFETADGLKMTVEVSAGNNDIGLRYHVPQQKGRCVAHVTSEATCYNFPDGTTSFLSPRTVPMSAWSRCQPSYMKKVILPTPR